MENKRCKYCQCYIMADATVCPHCKGVQESVVQKVVKRKKKNTTYLLIGIIAVLAVFGIVVSSSGKYKTEIKWALSDNYCFAVEVDSYDGDICEAGTYNARVEVSKKGFAPIYDIYIENELHDSISDLGEIDYSIGGNNAGGTLTIPLEAGQYVYIVPMKMAYEPHGYLVIEK